MLKFDPKSEGEYEGVLVLCKNQYNIDFSCFSLVFPSFAIPTKQKNGRLFIYLRRKPSVSNPKIGKKRKKRRKNEKTHTTTRSPPVRPHFFHKQGVRILSRTKERRTRRKQGEGKTKKRGRFLRAGRRNSSDKTASTAGCDSLYTERGSRARSSSEGEKFGRRVVERVSNRCDEKTRKTSQIINENTMAEPASLPPNPSVVIPVLETRFRAVEQEHQEIDKALSVVRDKIEASIAHLRKKPSACNGEEVGEARPPDESERLDCRKQAMRRGRDLSIFY